MTSKEPVPKSEMEKKSVAEELSALIRDESPALAGWACVIIASLIAFWLTEGKPYHQFAVGILVSSSALVILMAFFECLLRLLADRTF